MMALAPRGRRWSSISKHYKRNCKMSNRIFLPIFNKMVPKSCRRSSMMLTRCFIDVLLLQLYSTELNVNEIALSKAPFILNSPGFQRLDSLYACLDATKSWFELCLTFSPVSFVGFSISIFTQMAHCIITLHRLLTIDDPIWDRKLARDTADLSLILGKMIEKLSQVKVAADLDSGDPEAKDIFSSTGRTLESIKIWWDTKLAAELTNNVISDETLGETSMESFDDVWLENILYSGDGQFDFNMQWSSAGAGV